MIMKTFFFSIVLISLCISSFGSAALLSAGPVDEFTILSRYRAIDNSKLPTERTWIITAHRSAERGQVLRFMLQRKNSRETFGELISPDDSGGKAPVRWKAMKDDRSREGIGRLLIMSGYPAPCNVLPRHPERDKEVYQERREAGGQVFVKNYHLEREDVSIERARSQGWVTNDHALNGRPLQLITVLDDRDHLVARQLWPEGAAWWVYEETPFRQSWLVK